MAQTTQIALKFLTLRKIAGCEGDLYHLNLGILAFRATALSRKHGSVRLRPLLTAIVPHGDTFHVLSQFISDTSSK